MRIGTLVIALFVIALAPLAFISYYNGRVGVTIERPIADVQFEAETPKKLEVGQTFDIRACKILDGYRFELCLEGGKWIEAHLKIAARDEAGSFVVECLNKATPPPPTVTLLRQVNHYWIVDIHLNVENRRSNLLEILRAKGLLL